LSMDQHRAGVDGAVAVVTGATRGIGAETVRRLLAAGARGVVATGREQERLDAAWGSVDGGRVVTVAGRADDPGHAEQVVAAAIDAFGRCDILVNNAGTNPAAGRLVEVEPSALDKTWAVNQRAPLMFARAAWSGWMGEHGGAIVNVGSAGALVPGPTIGAYAVAKAALLHLTRQLALELAPGVRVNAVVPGIVKTTFSRRLWEGREAEAEALYPLRRLGEPADIAAAIVFLCSSDASWITGVALPVDGGLTQASAGADAALMATTQHGSGGNA
jgi:NAD(P)-dependent dehydrogenase (short-subunit alcohol dehydrogenase family)